MSHPSEQLIPMVMMVVMIERWKDGKTEGKKEASSALCHNKADATAPVAAPTALPPLVPWQSAIVFSIQSSSPASEASPNLASQILSCRLYDWVIHKPYLVAKPIFIRMGSHHQITLSKPLCSPTNDSLISIADEAEFSTPCPSCLTRERRVS